MPARRSMMLFAACAVMVGRGVLADSPPRGLLVVVSDTAPAEVKQAAQSVLAGVEKSPLLRIFREQSPAKIVSSRDFLAAKIDERAFSHLVLVGLPDDPVIAAAWQQEARPITAGANNGLYVFGWGNFLGDIGYLESDRNPFLHSQALKKTPYEAEEVTLTGSTPNGVKLAVDAFLRAGLVNGVVAGPGWKRGESTLLDRDPLGDHFAAPDIFPEAANGWTRIGITPASEDEYRGVLSDAGVEPSEIWRAKYYHEGVWDSGGADNAPAAYLAGLHRQSYGNTVWAARFADTSQATEAAGKIAVAAHLKKGKAGWSGSQPPNGFDSKSNGPLSLWVGSDWVFMSTLPLDAAVHSSK